MNASVLQLPRLMSNPEDHEQMRERLREELDQAWQQAAAAIRQSEMLIAQADRILQRR